MTDDKAKAYFDEEMSHISPCTEEEMEKLFPVNTENENRAVEGNLYRVQEAAAFFSNYNAMYMDLIQEGNLALVMALRGIEYYDENTSDRLNAAIRNAMQDYVDQENSNLEIGEEIKTRLNVMDEVCTALAKELDREPTPEEVAEKMKMDPDSVRYMMKMALSALRNSESE